MSFKSSLVFNIFVHFLNLRCVFINKNLQGFDAVFLQEYKVSFCELDLVSFIFKNSHKQFSKNLPRQPTVLKFKRTTQ